ncbi:MAG: NAD-dependent dehydratase [SAR116 cluster bacterium]|nr:NAD-dependent dehydratase [SAR116 cluster bacterium]RPH12335.1 MAG: SDR family NAD(P)-dependent oxidoreductase [Alphaproteobacteria bacterium TMED54]
MKILVTGANGFIGSHLVEKLVQDGFNVKAFVNYNSLNSIGWLSNSSKKILNNCEIFHGDVRDPNGVYEALKNCDTVIHLAALISIPYSYYSPDMYIETNVKGTLNILQAARKLNIRKIIHTSTSEVYGSAISIPINEKHPLQAQSPYSASKISADQLALSFYRSFGLPVSVIRPFNTFGPRQSARAIIPTIITQILSGAKEIKVGSLYPRRDFTFINDTVNGFIKSIEAKNIEGEIINLGTNHDISISDIISLIFEIFEIELTIVSDNKRIRPKKSEVDRLLSDNTLASKLINWSPLFKDKEGFKLGLKMTIEWFRKKENFQKYNIKDFNF